MTFLVTSYGPEKPGAPDRFWSIQTATGLRTAWVQHIRALMCSFPQEAWGEFTADMWLDFVDHHFKAAEKAEAEDVFLPYDNDNCWEHCIIRVNLNQFLPPVPNIKRALLRKLATTEKFPRSHDKKCPAYAGPECGPCVCGADRKEKRHA